VNGYQRSHSVLPSRGAFPQGLSHPVSKENLLHFVSIHLLGKEIYIHLVAELRYTSPQVVRSYSLGLIDLSEHPPEVVIGKRKVR
jgi:hypothetical protein